MRNTTVWLLSFLVSISFLSSGTLVPGHNTSQRHPSYPVSATDTPAGHVTILILDMSGTMADDDPYQVRCDAAKAFIDLSGPGNLVGLISMSGSQAQVWQSPTPTDVISERVDLKHAIDHPPAQIPDCQHPTGDTPVANALSLAWNMLNEVKQEGDNLQGSVILLSNGVPSPNPARQTATIDNSLLPEFQQNHWPIDTIALGPLYRGDIPRAFLRNIARRTGGLAYDGVQGPDSGEVSSLNILPFFTDILSRQVGNGWLGTLAPKTSIVDEVKKYNFHVTATDKGLYLLLIRNPQDQSNIQAQVISPGLKPLILSTSGNQPLPDGADLEQNASYAEFSIGGTASTVGNFATGAWELDVSGSGQFEAILLKTSWLQVALISPQQSTALLNIDSPLSLDATVVDERSPALPLSYQGLTLTAYITYHGGQNQTTLPPPYRYLLDRAPVPGQYQKTIHLPANVAEGTYTLTVTASGITGSLIAEDITTVLLFHFPTVPPKLYQVTEYQWPGWATTLYHWPFLNIPGTWVFSGSQAQFTTKIKLGSDSRASIVRATLSAQNGQQQQQLTIVDEGQGIFQLSLPTEPAGHYTLSLTLKGSIDGFPFDSGPTSGLSAQVDSAFLTPSMYSRLETMTIALALLLLILLGGTLVLWYQSATGVKPFGGCKCEETEQYHSFIQTGQYFWLQRDRYRPGSEQFSLPAGLRFRFYRKIPLLRPKGGIKARLNGNDGIYWSAQYNKEPQILSRCRYRKVSRLTHAPFAGEKRELLIGEAKNYTLHPTDPNPQS